VVHTHCFENRSGIRRNALHSARRGAVSGVQTVAGAGPGRASEDDGPCSNFVPRTAGRQARGRLPACRKRAPWNVLPLMYASFQRYKLHH